MKICNNLNIKSETVSTVFGQSFVCTKDSNGAIYVPGVLFFFQFEYTNWLLIFLNECTALTLIIIKHSAGYSGTLSVKIPFRSHYKYL